MRHDALAKVTYSAPIGLGEEQIIDLGGPGQYLVSIVAHWETMPEATAGSVSALVDPFVEVAADLGSEGGGLSLNLPHDAPGVNSSGRLRVGAISRLKLHVYSAELDAVGLASVIVAAIRVGD